ncbi:molybdopterin converting factor subunit 1 [Sandarakinorhabdus sp.]|uniref:molybdopterin converting factor subunit 1 n=1 Tax=Sandarakinorhabdus sp. TaxID=1916663 RepID=UPI00356638C6
MVQLLYFAWVREMIGTDSETIALPAEATTVAALLDWLAARSPGHAAALADRSRIRVAVDQNFATLATQLAAPREIAIFPPVTGG